MKNKKLLLSLLALTVLTGCNNTIGGLKKGDDVLNGTIIDNNFEEEVNEEEEVNTLVQSKLGEVTFKEEDILETHYAGVVVTINEQGYVGFYSLLHQKQIIANQYERDWMKYNIDSDNHIGFTIKIKYEGKQSLYDSLGNLLYFGDEKNDVYYGTDSFNDTVYLTIEEYDENGNPSRTYFKYLENGKIQEVEDITQDVLANLPTPEESEFPFGSQYNELTSLKEYGLDGYVSFADNLLSLYNENKEFVKTVTIPSNAESFAVIGDKFYYQVYYMLPEDAKEYDVYYTEYHTNFVGVKYDVESYSINLETGKTKKEDIEFLIYDFEPYKGETEGKNYSILTMQLINKDKTAGEIVSYLVDGEGVLHDRVDAIELEDFVKVGNNYYNDDTGILYDSSLKEIANIGTDQYEIDEEAGYFIGYINDHFGILNSSGKVALEFTADQIVTEIIDDKVITVRDDVYYRNDLLTGKEEMLGVNLGSLGNGLYCFSDSEFIYFHNVAGLLEKIEIENINGFDFELIETSINNGSYIFVEAYYQYETEVYDEETQENVNKTVEETKYITFDINQLPSLETIGTEKTTEINYGTMKKIQLN